MYILDTNHLSIADQNTIEGFNLNRRLAAMLSDFGKVPGLHIEDWSL